MAYGPPVALTEVMYPYDPARPELVPRYAAVHADADGVAMAITAENTSITTEDTVGWVFLAW